MGSLLAGSVGVAQGQGGYGHDATPESGATNTATTDGPVTAPVTSSGSGPPARRHGRIAYISFPGGNAEVFTIRADGSHPRRLTHTDAFDHGPDWSPSGRRLVFGRYNDDTGSIFWTMRRNGRDKQRLGNGIGGVHPSWSPSGHRIAFASNDGNDYEIYTVRRDGTGMVQLTHNEITDNHPVWSPSGRRIAYDADLNGTDYDIYIKRPDGSHRQRITHNTIDDSMPAYSPWGRRIAYESGRRDGEIFVKQLRSGQRRQVTHDAIDTSQPWWSPNGRRLVYVQDDGAQIDLYTIRLNGTGEQQITNTAMPDLGPKWAPRPR